MPGECNSCGRKMVSEEEHAGQTTEHPFCYECADHEGNLYSRRTVREKVVDRIMSERDVQDRRRARQFVENKLDNMPAWQDN